MGELTHEDYRRLRLDWIKIYRRRRMFELARRLIWELRMIDGIRKGVL